MATVTDATLRITEQAPAVVRATVRYTLTLNKAEKTAGTTFTDTMSLIGDDPGVISDVVIQGFGPDTFAPDPALPNIKRERSVAILKKNMNEDPDFLSTGAEQRDEVFARINLTYATNPPVPPALPPEATTNSVKGAWR